MGILSRRRAGCGANLMKESVSFFPYQGALLVLTVWSVTTVSMVLMSLVQVCYGSTFLA